MRHFLQNLVDRHQDNPVHLESNMIVQPRLKARFETDNGGAEVIADHNDENSSSRIKLESESNSVQPNVAQQSNLAIPPIANSVSKADSTTPENSTSSAQEDNTNNQLNDRLGVLNEVLPVNQVMDDTVQSHPEVRPTVYKNEAPEATIKQPQPANFSLDIKQRIQAILDRINHLSESDQDGEQHNDSFGNEQPFSEIHNNVLKPALNTGFELTPEISQQNSDPVSPGKTNTQDDTENKQSESKSNQSGALQTPAWLSEMRREFQTRGQQIQDYREPEPVVNVTIGRLEVKAVSANHPRRPASAKKPTGVMNLEDYLKQRGRKGSL